MPGARDPADLRAALHIREEKVGGARETAQQLCRPRLERQGPCSKLSSSCVGFKLRAIASFVVNASFICGCGWVQCELCQCKPNACFPKASELLSG